MIVARHDIIAQSIRVVIGESMVPEMSRLDDHVPHTCHTPMDCMHTMKNMCRAGTYKDFQHPIRNQFPQSQFK